MTSLLEHQAKALLGASGLAIPDGRLVASANDAVTAAAAVGLPVAVKAQVRSGNRAPRGLVARCDDERCLRDRVATMLTADDHGEPVRRVLVEPWITFGVGYYVAVASDTSVRRPCLLTNRSGGTGVEARSAAVQRTVLPADARLTPWQLVDLARGHFGAEGGEVTALADALSSILEVYREHHAWLVEVNPLARLEDDSWLAVDAKMRLDGDALLQRDLTGPLADMDILYADREATDREQAAAELDRHDHRGSVHFVEIDPGGRETREAGQVPIAMHCVGTGASLALMDELEPEGFRTVNFCDTSGSPSREKVHAITRLVLQQPGIEGYLFVSSVATQELTTTAEGIIDAVRDAATDGTFAMPILIVLRGNQDEQALHLLRTAGGPMDGPHVELLGRDTTEADAARAFARLHATWRSESP